MRTQARIVVVGLGEVGKPLYELAAQYHETVGVDIEPVAIDGSVDVLHICYPFQIRDFVGESVRYIKRYRPALTVINSTVAVGTTRVVEDGAQSPVVNSPVRGKHARMLQDMQKYTKFLGATDSGSAERAAQHFESLGLKTKVLSSPEATELAKLTETTYFGVMIAWAQEVERYCDKWGANYDQVSSFYEEIAFFPPVKYFPGVIGGHCVMQNIEILTRSNPTILLDAIKVSNEMKVERELRSKKEAVLV